MPDDNKSWLRLRLEDGLRRGLTQAYETVKVDPQHFLLQLRTGYGLPISTFDGVFSVPEEQLNLIAVDVIRSSMKMAAVEGAGFGLGGVLTIVPDLSILAGITIRTIQKLSLIYGFQFGIRAESAQRGSGSRVLGGAEPNWANAGFGWEKSSVASSGATGSSRRGCGPAGHRRIDSR